MMNLEECREAFEAWARSQPEMVDGDLRRKADGYWMFYVNRVWLGWQAAWNAAQPKPPAANTVRVRIPVIVNDEGDYYARTVSDVANAREEAMRLAAQWGMSVSGARVTIVTVDVPKPDIAEVRGEVEA